MKLQNIFHGWSMAVAFGAMAATAGADGGIDSRVLGEMGLAGLAILSDNDAASIRGFGYSHSGAGVYGHSWANVHTKGGSAGSVNGYKANGKYYAVGNNHSFAKIEVKKSGGKHSKPRHGNYASKGGGRYGGGGHGGGGHGGMPRVKSIKAVAGGGSFAKAK